MLAIREYRGDRAQPETYLDSRFVTDHDSRRSARNFACASLRDPKNSARRRTGNLVADGLVGMCFPLWVGLWDRYPRNLW